MCCQRPREGSLCTLRFDIATSARSTQGRNVYEMWASTTSRLYFDHFESHLEKMETCETCLHSKVPDNRPCFSKAGTSLATRRRSECPRAEGSVLPPGTRQDLGTTGTTTIVPRRCRPASQDPLAPLMGPRERERHCNGIKGAIELPKTWETSYNHRTKGRT